MVRLYGLTDYGIWFDEAYHVQLVKLPTVSHMLEAVLANPPSDPLYVLLLRPWAMLFGTHDASIRTLSVIFSTATIPAAFAFGRAVGGPRPGTAGGLLGALLLALSPYAVELGQEAALYALASLTTTLALTMGLRWRALGRGRWLYLATGIAAIYSHYVVAAILALFWLLAPLFERRRPERDWTLVHAAILLAWIPWLIPLLFNWLSSTAPRAGLRITPTFADIEGALVQFTTGNGALHAGGWVLQVTGVGAMALLLINTWWAGRDQTLRSLRMVIALSAIVFLLPAGISAVTGYWLFVPHFMIFLLPALFVACGIGACKSRATASVHREWQRHAAVLVVTTWVLSMLVGLNLFYRYPPHGADGLRELAATISADRGENDVVIVSPPALQASLAQYLPGEIRGLPEDFDLKRVYLPYGRDEWRERTLRRLPELAKGRDRIWLVHIPLPGEEGELLLAAQGSYQQVRVEKYPFATLYLYADPGPHPIPDRR
jgi:MFS family permease